MEIIILVATVLVFVFIAAFVFYSGPYKPSNKYFCLLIAAIILWIASLYFSNNILSQALFWTRMTFVASAFLALFLIEFVLVYPEDRKISFLDQVTLFTPCLFIVGLLFTDKIIKSITYIETGTGVQQGGLYYLFMLFFISYVIGAIVILVKKFTHARGLLRARLLYLLTGLSISLLIGTSTNMLIPFFFKIDTLNVYGPYSTIVLILFTSYAIVRHKLFNIRLVIRKIVVYSVLLAMVFGIYTTVTFIITSYLPISRAGSNFLAAIIIAFGFEPLRNWLQSATEKYLFVSEYKPSEELQKLTSTLSNVVDLDEALRQVIQRLILSMKLARGAALVLAPNEKHKVMVRRIQEINFPNPQRLMDEQFNPIVVYFQHVPHICLTSELQQEIAESALGARHKKLLTTSREESPSVVDAQLEGYKKEAVKLLNKLKVEVVVPILVKDQLIGLLYLGGKLSNDGFYEDDLNFLSVVGSQTGSAIEKARFYEEDQLKSEFVSIASHELLTPTTAIEGYLSMILDENMAKVDPKAHEYLQKVYESSKRLSTLVKDLLSVSRIEAGRIKIEPKPFDLAELVQQQVDQLIFKAKDANLTLTYARPKKEVTVFADPDRTAQAVVNLVGNAIKYTKQGSVKVEINEQAKQVEVAVIDTGMGIKPEDREHLFEKFQRVNTTETAGIIGSGLGLYITKSIVELMNGVVTVKSTYGKGSTFAFTLPKKRTNHK